MRRRRFAAVGVVLIVLAADRTVPVGAEPRLQAAQPAGHALAGTVFDQQGLAVAGVEMAMHGLTVQWAGKAKTDQAGHYEFAGLLPGQYVIQARKPGFFLPPTPLLIENDDAKHDIRLPLGGVTEDVLVAGPTKPSTTGWAESGKRHKPPRCSTGERRGGDVIPPTKIRHTFPAYPREAWDARLGGRVEVAAVITAEGHIAGLHTVAATSPMFEQSVLDAVSQWEFDPAYLDCVPMELQCHVTVTFSRTRGY